MIDKIYSNILLKFSKKEYLQSFISGKMYFKKLSYYLENDENRMGDTREGKRLIHSIELVNSKNEKLLIQDTEINIIYEKIKDIPVFCCSWITTDILEKDDNDVYFFSDTFIKEMALWGEYVLIFDKSELISKIEKACYRKGYVMDHSEIIYDRDNLRYDIKEYLSSIKLQFEGIFHKNKDYANQNEYRIALITGEEISEDFFELEIEPLQNYQILKFEDLKNMCFKVKRK